MRHRVVVAWLVLLLAGVACGSPTSASRLTTRSPSLLLIVGDVTSTSARVLVDATPHSPASPLARVFRQSPVDARVRTLEQEIPLDHVWTASSAGRPHVVVLEGLVPGNYYIVAFHLSSAVLDEIVRFRTPHVHTPTRVLVVSCDRFVDDHDDALWLAIEKDLDAHSDAYFGMAHIGDQVYVDAGAARVAVRTTTAATTDPTRLRGQYDEIVDDFRAIYRATLGRPAAQRVLRRGAHWMLPDDHEVLNNVNTVAVDRIFSGDDETQRGRQLHYRAGIQTLYEFQYQLHGDVKWEEIDFLSDPLDSILTKHPLYFNVEIDRLKLFFLDVRFDRSFTLQTRDELQHLVSPTQRDALHDQLTQWTSDDASSSSSIVVLAALPLFFHSTLTASIAYAVEKELYPGHPEHARGLRELYDVFQSFRPSLKLLVGGDVHTLAHMQICGGSTFVDCLDQLVTSGLTNGSTAINDAKLVPFYLLILRLYPLYDWLMAAMGLSSTPWVLAADRVFLGRNYGVLEIDAQGQFEWRHSVTIDHDGLAAQLTQFVFDVLRPQAIAAVCAVLYAVWRVRKRVVSNATHNKTE